ncbi:MAG: hypothetical protein V1712_00740 [Patescibacteria group bacterium]
MKNLYEIVEDNLKKIIATVCVLMLVGFVLAYLIPSVAYPILMLSMLIWISLHGWLYDQSKYRILLLGNIILALVGWILYFTAEPVQVNNLPFLCTFALLVFTFGSMIGASVLTLFCGMIFYSDRKRKNRILSIPPGMGCTV